MLKRLRRVVAFLLWAGVFGVAGAQGFFKSKEPLSPDKAFQLAAVHVPGFIEARWTITPEYYLYRDKFVFVVQGATAGTPAFPPAEWKEDPSFGRVEIYRGDVLIRIPVREVTGPLTLQATSQGCADLGICYPPQTVTLQLAAVAGGAASVTAQTTVAATAPAPAESEQGGIVRMLKQGSLWLNLASFFGFGLLLAFTPCVLPMVPILSGIIVGHGHNISHGRAFVLSSVYGLGMAVTYAAAGVAAGLSGSLLSGALQNPWVLGAFALVFVVLALAMFGLYELQLPTALQSRLSVSANRQGGSLRGIALMGALSAIIVGPCVAAPLAGALLYIAQTGDAVLGGAALFAMALGMGLPLVAVGTFSRSLLPKTGPWMEGIKKVFGLILLATALWLIKPVIPGWAFMLGCAALLLVPGVLLRAIDALPPHAKTGARLAKALGLALLLWGLAILAGMLAGVRDPLQPLNFLQARPAQSAPPFVPVRSVAELDNQLAAAQAAAQPVLLDFYADWCVSCIEMEEQTFADPTVVPVLKQFRLLRVDVTANTADDATLLKRFGLFGPPGIIFYDRKGQEHEARRVIGFKPPRDFLPLLKQALE